MTSYELNIRDYWRILKRRKKIILLSGAVLALLTFLMGEANAPRPLYEATASVKVERSSTMAGLFMEVLTWSPMDNIATQTSVIRSYPVLAESAARLGMMPSGLGPDDVRADTSYMAAVSKLQSMVKTEQEGATNIINITVSAASPDEAQNMANTVAEAYRDQNIEMRNRQTTEGRKFIESQRKVVGERLAKAEESLRSYKETSGVLDINAEVSQMMDRTAELESEQGALRRRMDEAVKGIAALKADRAAPGDGSRLFTEGSDSSLFRLNSLLTDLQLKRENLLMTYLSTHPLIADLDSQITNTRGEMAGELTAKLTSYREKDALLTRDIAGLRARLGSAPEAGLELARRERDVKVNAELYAQLEARYQEALIREAERIEEVSIIRPATAPSRPVNPPKRTAHTVLGFGVGILLGLVLAFLLESVDTSIGTIEEVEDFLNVPVIGVIPDFGKDRLKKEMTAFYPKAGHDEIDMYSRLVTHFAPKSNLSESYRSLRTNIEFLGIEMEHKVFLFTSSALREGKTTTVVNLATVLAQLGRRVMVVDADLRKPTVHHVFGLESHGGLTDVLMGSHTWQEVTRTATDIMLGRLGVDNLMLTPGLDNVNVITAGAIPPNPAEFLHSPKLPALIMELRKEYDIVIFDTPPVLPITDAMIIADKVDGVVIVYQVGRMARFALKRSKALIENVGGKLLGVVLSGVRAEVSSDYYAHSYYYSDEEAGDDKPHRWKGRVKKRLDTWKDQ
ncbi:MAG: polysaccharide biosynthesis tyrosine autokinase [Nitrospirae bacterium]|nr:polysaccharide biosynthesis tyrosine autokinase [Nitrospirota bacterium]MBI5694942.1 polysaccharide biosynthesis tyrosine autokinase [Nitrospirota bacterium]